MGFNQLYIDTLGLTGWSFGLSFAVLLTSLWFGFPLLNGVCISLCTGLSLWHTVIMPGSVSCIIWFLSFFGVWGLLFSSLFPPSFGALSLYPSTYNLVRFLGEWSQNLIAFFEWRTLVFVIFVFEKIIVDFCCCLSRRCLSPLHHLCVSLFLYVDWLCIYLSLSFSPASLSWTPYLSHLSLYVFDMGVLRLFWLVSMLHPTLADLAELYFFGSLFSLLVMWCTHIWLRIISVL